MEDISRELEKEIAQAKPKPYKQERKTRIIIIDDFGTMKSGEFLKKVLLILSVASATCFIMAVVFCQLYFGLVGETKDVKTQLAAAKTKVQALAGEKEVLMARLVISGKEPGISEKQIPKEVKKGSDTALNQKDKLAKLDSPPEKSPLKIDKKKPIVSKKQDVIKPQVDVTSSTKQTPSTPKPPNISTTKTVSIEKFTVRKDASNGDLLVRFDIRNTSKTPGDVSGRIFTLLKSDDNDQSKWLVVPSSNLKDGVPAEYRKGQYFSIAHFKPVKFRIKNKKDPDLFKKASIFIFNNQGALIFEELISITEAN